MDSVPVSYRRIPFEPGTVNLDYGGGSSSKITEYLAELGVRNLVYDPFARSKSHNKQVLKQIRDLYGVDTVTCMNVLNLIKEPSVRLAVIRNCYRALKPKGFAYFSVVWEQINMLPLYDGEHFNFRHKLQYYLPYVREVFPFAWNKTGYIVARKIINKEFEVKPLIIDGYYYD